MTDGVKIALYERYKADEVSEQATRLLLGNDFELLQEDSDAFAAAVEDDTSKYLV